MIRETMQAMRCPGLLLVLACFGMAQAAYAPHTLAQEPEAEEVLEETVVTGSRIKGAAESGILPVSILSRGDLDAFGSEVTGDLLSNLAQAGALEFNDSSDGPNSARGDVSTVNLRGLGAGNTLVLLNGRRLVQHPFSQDVDETPRSVVNVNVIPAPAIGRVEVLKDGASALYGADASAGVVNSVLRSDYEGFRISVRHGESESIGYAVDSVNFSGGMEFNGGLTHVAVFASLYGKDGIFARERDYAASVDKRPLLPASWADDRDFRNLSSLSPWGQFQAGVLEAEGIFRGQRVSDGGGALTNSVGVFHVQPAGTAGERAQLVVDEIGLDDGNINNDSSRYDFNIPRQLSPETDRYNLFVNLSHSMDNGMELFGELGWYQSESHSQRAAQPIDQGLAFIVIPKTNYYNPFGPVTFAGGVTNPNRLPGLDADVPAAGLDLLLARWRPVDHGPRIIDTESSMFRFLAGVRGVWGDWDWETAWFHNFADAEDQASNRISKTLLEEQLELSTPEAINPFHGPGVNSREQFDRVRVKTTNEAESSISSWDFRVSHSSLFFSPWADEPAGVALGLEWRHEDYEDNRDSRLDGTITYRQGLGGDRSDVAGVSPTADSEGERNVYSAYGELFIPLLSPRPWAQRLDFQFALRFESMDDVNEDILKPKYALAWQPRHWMTVRGTYAEGFRVPNLLQLYRGDVSRLRLGFDDFWRQQAGLGDAGGDIYRRHVRESNEDLESEETETSGLGLRFDVPLLDVPWLGNLLGDDPRLLLSVDYWRFRQFDVVDNFGGEEQLALDFLLRSTGDFNPLVIRTEPTAEDILAFVNAGLNPEDAAGRVLYIRDPYVNLDPRLVEGIDYALRLEVPATRYGDFNLQLEASRLMTFKQRRDSAQDLLGNLTGANIDAAELADLRASIQSDRLELDGNPRWKMAGTLSWRLGDYGAGWSLSRVDGFYDTSAIHNSTNEFWRVDSWTVMNAYFDYRFSYMDKRLRARFGVNNL